MQALSTAHTKIICGLRKMTSENITHQLQSQGQKSEKNIKMNVSKQ